MRWLARDTISLANQLRFGSVAPLEDVEGVSFDRLVLGKLLLVGNPFELPGLCGDPSFG